MSVAQLQIMIIFVDQRRYSNLECTNSQNLQWKRFHVKMMKNLQCSKIFYIDENIVMDRVSL